MVTYTLNFDGSCGPKNPGGTAAYGFILKRGDEIVESGHGVIGTGEGMSNNLAEFHALAQGLYAFGRATEGDKLPSRLNVLGDSKLVIEIMNGYWRARSDKLYYPAYQAADEAAVAIRLKYHPIRFAHVYREKNQECDDLSKAHQTEAAPFEASKRLRGVYDLEHRATEELIAEAPAGS